MNISDHAFAVILAGGGGTRLWPKSRNQTPKQFLKLTSDRTMMQVAADRVTKMVDWDHVIVVTNAQYLDEVKSQLPEVPVQNIIAEPAKKDTALAMLVGTLFAYSQDPEAVVLNGASDHVVTDVGGFVKVMEAALQEAATGENLVTVGITPTFPSSAFGYIKIGEDLRKINRDLSVFKVNSFTEKPNVATARAFISTGKYFWNANMYVWAAKTLMQAFQKHQPETYALTESLATLQGTAFQKALPAIYEQATAISIDYAISEKADNLVLLPGDFGWNDVGDWKVVYDLGKKDSEGNVVTGDSHKADTVIINSQHNLIHANGRLVALIGVEDLIVVDTDEILMIVPKNQSQDVKKAVEQLKADGKTEYL